MSKIEERYARATRSSHLQVTEHPGDADTLIAAGLSDSLGVMLARLRAEWDTVSKRELAQAADDLTARVLVLMNLRTLEPTKQALLNFARVKSASLRLGLTAQDLAPVIGKVLDSWLGQLCMDCNGLGFSGGYGKARILCPTCHGSTKRKQGRLHETEDLHQFGLWLLNVMDAKCAGAMGEIHRKTRQV